MTHTRFHTKITSMDSKSTTHKLTFRSREREIGRERETEREREDKSQEREREREREREAKLGLVEPKSSTTGGGDERWW